MGDENTLLIKEEVIHLLRRTGFGWPAWKANYLTGKTRGKAVDTILHFKPVAIKPFGTSILGVHNSWLRMMHNAPNPLQEKLVLFWHDHFATSAEVVFDPRLMSAQNGLLRKFCKGDFKAFVKEVNRNPAMMEFLDTVRNRKEIPNENYSRELQELFTTGVKDLNGNDNYTQEDIVQIARAFTGWDFLRDTRNLGKPNFRSSRHDFMAAWPTRGPKVIYKGRPEFPVTPQLPEGGRTFAANAGEEGEAEIDRVVDIIFDHRDSDGESTVARHITKKLFEYFAYASPSKAVIDDIVGTSGFDTTWSIHALLRALFIHDAFYESAAAAPFSDSTKKSVKWPIDFVISTMRLLNVRPDPRYFSLLGGDWRPLQDHLTEMGQRLLEPPSVFGWDWETSWLSTKTLLARYTFARDLTSARWGSYITRFRPERVVKVTLTKPADILDAALNALGIADQLTVADKQILIDYLTDNDPDPDNYVVDLTNDYVRNVKLHGLFALILQSPAYQLQ
jgi:uncharacterized protein (DUF1800 family)